MKALPDNIAIALAHTREAFACFMRNGRWGTCGSCPRLADGMVVPELCPNTEGSDHHLTLEGLVDQYNRWRRA